MLHAKFQEHRPTGSGEDDLFKVFTIFGHGGHLVHVICTIYINFFSHFPRRLQMKFGIDWPSGFSEEDVENIGYIHVYRPGAGADKPLWSSSFH